MSTGFGLYLLPKHRCKMLQVTYYESLNSLVLFIQLGIGADGMFVFFDFLRQSEMNPETCGTEATRFQYTVQRAARATLVTSFTTAVSFFATYISRWALRCCNRRQPIAWRPRSYATSYPVIY